MFTYSVLESSNLLVSHGVSFCNDWDQVDLGMQSAHDLNIEWLECMSSWLNEVHTGMNSVVNNVHSVDFVLGIEVGIKTLLDVVHNWSPRLVIVDEVTKTRGIDNSQPEAYAILLDICAY